MEGNIKHRAPEPVIALRKELRHAKHGASNPLVLDTPVQLTLKVECPGFIDFDYFTVNSVWHSKGNVNIHDREHDRTATVTDTYDNGPYAFYEFWMMTETLLDSAMEKMEKERGTTA